jgi:hypothetical protein
MRPQFITSDGGWVNADHIVEIEEVNDRGWMRATLSNGNAVLVWGNDFLAHSKPTYVVPAPPGWKVVDDGFVEDVLGFVIIEDDYGSDSVKILTPAGTMGTQGVLTSPSGLQYSGAGGQYSAPREADV